VTGQDGGRDRAKSSVTQKQRNSQFCKSARECCLLRITFKGRYKDGSGSQNQLSALVRKVDHTKISDGWSARNKWSSLRARCEFIIIMSGYYTSLEGRNEKGGDEQCCIKAP
jgi:hypothetical protein